MRITKLGHSCVLVETPDRVALFDAGGWADKSLIKKVKHVDRIVYTHEHPDHFDIEILKGLVLEFPEAHVVCNQAIAQLIKEANIQVVVREETNCCRKFSAPHEQLPLPGVQAPTENGYHFQNIFTHPGDSQTFFETKAVLAMPFIGPWGKTGDSIAKVLDLKPQYVLPIHDWHYTDEAKAWLHNMLKVAFRSSGITLLPNNHGEPINLQLAT